MKRWIAGLLCALLCCGFLGGAVQAEAVAAIDTYQADCVIDAHGGAKLTVTVSLTLPTAVTRLDFPIGAGEKGAVAGQDVKAVKTDEGTVLRLTDEAGISGSRSFVITYTLPRVVTETADGQALSLDLIAPGWTLPISAASFSVTMPEAFSETPSYLGGYYGDTVEDYLDLTSNGTVFSGSFTEALRDHDSLQVTLALPADYVNLQSADGISSLVTLVFVLLLAVFCVFYWYRTLYNRRLSVAARPIPPDGAGAGELPLLLTCQKPSLPLQVMQWASMGYAAIHLNARGRIVLRQTMSMGTERRKQERGVFGVLFEKDSWCDGESLRFGRLAGRYAAAMRAYWNRRVFSKTSGSPALLRLLVALAAGIALLGSASAGLPVGRLRLVFLIVFAVLGAILGWVMQYGCIAIARRQPKKALLCAASLAALFLAARILGGMAAMLPALLLQVFAAVSTLRGGRRSPGGRDNLAQTLGFQRYLRHVTQHQLVLLLRDDSQYFYRMLPFAEAMGLGAEFADRFGEITLEPCAWFETQKRPAATAPLFYQQFHAVLSRMDAAEK